MFERAMAGTHLTELVSVNAADGSRRLEEAPRPVRPKVKATAVATAGDTRSAEIGPFTGASAKRRRRKGR
jgi:hypothetical protein